MIAALCAAVLAGIDWGLPARTSDQYLFGMRSAWTGAELAAYDRDRTSAAIGADVDRDPIDRSRGPITVNQDDQLRGQILRRYRLFSNQPDEMITFMALQQMNPADRDFDPRLYQYGGLWTYGVGALLKSAATVGLVELRADVAHYYDNPAAFGRFYIVARAYTLFWYAVLLIAVAMIARGLSGAGLPAITAAALVGLAPVVFATAHEAKPHLAGAALMCLACLGAARWIATGRHRDASLAGALCGLCAGMILSASVVAVLLLVMIFLRPGSARQRLAALALGITAMVAAYAITNPYVVIHLVNDRAALTSNFINTKAMYASGPIGASAIAAAWHFFKAASLPLLALGAAAIIAVLARRPRVMPIAVLLVAPALIVLVPFVVYAAQKPGEYARFAVYPVVVLAILGSVALSVISRAWMRLATAMLVCAAVAVFGTRAYVIAFAADTQHENTRLITAARLDALWHPGKTLQIFADPAPYSLPPVGLWRWRINLTLPTAPLTGDVVIRPVDDPRRQTIWVPGYTREVIDLGQPLAPITWANKPFELLIRDRAEAE
ncbi:MAG: hypothetical protein H7144_15110 [Burkholderiales bacterium]|nr:hypothetical protein [Phycisphaerae bacterium]